MAPVNVSPSISHLTWRLCGLLGIPIIILDHNEYSAL